jgi:lipoprotein-anchoring transpeptidase ErfK/SrfK
MRRSNQPGVNQRIRGSRTQYAAFAMLSVLFGAPGAPAAEPIKPAPSQRTIVISLPDRKLAVVEDGRLQQVFQIAVGKLRTPSPMGELRVINKIVRPTYYHQGVVVKPGTNNPLGPRWIGLSRPGYGIHGTNEPGSIGKAASHGCFRMRNTDVKTLFTLVQVGDTVEIHSSRDRTVSSLFPGEDREIQSEALSTLPEQRTDAAAMEGEF